MAGATVLLVDDRDTTLEAALQFHGFDVQTVRTGRGALTAAADPSVDAVVLEVDLADIDGFEVCRRLRSAGDTTPLVFLSGRASVEDRVRGIAAGADDYIPKPVDLEELVTRLRVVMQGGTVAAGRPARLRRPRAREPPAGRQRPAQPAAGAEWPRHLRRPAPGAARRKGS